MTNTSERLKEAMRIRDIKQAELVEKTGINKGALSSYLAGRYNPKQGNLFLLARALNVNEAWLMGADVPMEKSAEQIRAIETGTILGKAARDPKQIELLENYQKLDAGNREKLLQFSEALTLLP